MFTDPAGNFGNPLGVADAATIEPDQHQRVATELGDSETIFVDLPVADSASAHARIHTPATELPFAGHPRVGASWWLRDIGNPMRTLQVPAGIVQVSYDADLTAISARSERAPDFAIHDLESLQDLAARRPRRFPPQGWVRVANDGVRQVS